MISWYCEYLSFKTTNSTGSTGGGVLIRPCLDLATGSLRDFLPRTASTRTALLGASSRAAWTLLPPITWNMSAKKYGNKFLMTANYSICFWNMRLKFTLETEMLSAQGGGHVGDLCTAEVKIGWSPASSGVRHQTWTRVRDVIAREKSSWKNLTKMSLAWFWSHSFYFTYTIYTCKCSKSCSLPAEAYTVGFNTNNGRWCANSELESWIMVFFFHTFQKRLRN